MAEGWRVKDDHNHHHVYYYKSNYRGQLERTFRNLPCHVMFLDIRRHNELHATQPPLPKPSREVMLAALERHRNRQCAFCHRGEEDHG